MQCVYAFIGKTDKSNGKHGFLQGESGVWRTRCWSSRICSVFYSKHKLPSSGRRRHDNVGYKSTDRSRLNALVAQKGNCDDIIIVKHGLLTDTSFTNLAIFDGKHWVTPRHPLLPGTKRAALLDKGMIQKADITLEDLRNANKVSLFNAMIEFGEREIAMENVHFWTFSISSDIQDILWL